MTLKHKIIIGTSGWNYKHWIGTFYPEELKQKDWLKYYYERFTSVELNASFYHLPRKETFEKWRQAVPKGFTFAVKASRYITHMKKLNEPEDSLKLFFDNAFALEDKLGPVLFQLPPGWGYNPERFNIFLTKLPKDIHITFEFRNQSWWNEEVYKLLKQYNFSFCIFELAGLKTPEVVTADHVYVRLHGPTGHKYQGSYSEETLKHWSEKFKLWQQENRTVYCYFDNDDSGYAAHNALTIKKMTN